jgi:hypothetical protein
LGGGGIYAAGITDGADITFTLSRSLVSGNTAPDGAEVAYESNGSSVVTTAYNLFGHSGLTTAEAIAGLTPAASDITATSDGSEPTALAAILEPTLQNNGGPTRTQNLVPGSPAIDAAPADANCPATDQRGESRPRGTACDIGAVEFEAGFTFSGFFAPVNNPPVFNTVKAGQGVPVKFSLDGDQGLVIFDAEYPQSWQITCDTTAPVDDITTTTVTTGGSSLTYEPSTAEYIYVWKTDKAWAGTCRQFLMKLTDGSQHVANFQFTK